MLIKLLKYDLKWVYKPLIVFYLLAIFFSIIVRIVESFETTLILLIIDKICCGIVISMIISILINCFMRNFSRFIINIYKDEAYLTHTLPIHKNTIFLSKILTIIITLFTSFIIIVLCLAISSLNKSTWIILKESLETSSIYFNSSIINLILIMIITIFFEFLFIMLCGILGIIIGYKKDNYKLIKSILYGFVIYVLLSLISVAIMFVFGLLNKDIMNIFNSIVVSSHALKNMMLLGIMIYGLYNLGIYHICIKLFNRGVNIE